MSNRKDADNSDDNDSESKSNDGKLSNAEANDPTQNPPQNPELGHSNRQDNEDEEGNSDPNLSTDEMVIFEMQELSSEESSQGDKSDAVEGLKVLYEFPDDSERSDVDQSMPQSQKRRNDDKNENSAKKLKNDKPNAKDNESKGKDKFKTNGQPLTSDKPENDYSNQEYKGAESNDDKNMEKRSSSTTLDNHRLISKPLRRLSKGKGNKKPTHIETHDGTNTFKRVTLATITSEGAMADVEDNADSQSNDDISDVNEKSQQKPISNNANINSGKLVTGREGSSNSIQSVDSQMADVEDNADSQSNDDISDENEKSPQKPIFKHTNTNSAKLVAGREGSANFRQFVDIHEETSSQNKVKADSGTSGVVSESNTSSRPACGKDGKASTSSATNQFNKKSNVERLKKRRCFVCNKKLGLTAFTCRCGGLYCSQHRYDREHDCKFDYKSMGAEEIRKNNPQIVAEKISKL